MPTSDHKFTESDRSRIRRLLDYPDVSPQLAWNNYAPGVPRLYAEFTLLESNMTGTSTGTVDWIAGTLTNGVSNADGWIDKMESIQNEFAESGAGQRIQVSAIGDIKMNAKEITDRQDIFEHMQNRLANALGVPINKHTKNSEAGGGSVTRLVAV